MKMTMEEKHVRFIWYVLDKIKGELLLNTDQSNLISYNLFLYPQPNGWDKPNSVIEQKILDMLIKWKAIKITKKAEPFQVGVEEKTRNPQSAGSTYFFQVNTITFEKYYAKYKRLLEQYEKANYEGNTLFFHDNGEIEYINESGKKYRTKLKNNTNNYNLLKYLAYNPRRVYSIQELAKHLKDVRSDVESSDDDRRVRDTIKGIKEKLRYKENSLFESNNGFGLQCNVVIKK